MAITKKTTKNKTMSCGSCDFKTFSPQSAGSIKSLTLKLTFEEALKLNAAVGECVRRLNNHNRATATGKNKRLQIILHLHKKRVIILEGDK